VFQPPSFFLYKCPSCKIFQQGRDVWCTSFFLGELTMTRFPAKLSLVAPSPFSSWTHVCHACAFWDTCLSPPSIKKMAPLSFSSTASKIRLNLFLYLQKLALVIPLISTFNFLSVYFTQHVVLLYLLFFSCCKHPHTYSCLSFSFYVLFISSSFCSILFSLSKRSHEIGERETKGRVGERTREEREGGADSGGIAIAG
jgi:hypothetical protein